MNSPDAPARTVRGSTNTAPVPASAREWRALPDAVRAEAAELARRGASATDPDVARAAAAYGRYLARRRRVLGAGTFVAVLAGAVCAIVAAVHPAMFSALADLPGVDALPASVTILLTAAVLTTAARLASRSATRRAFTGDVNLARITAASPYLGTPRATVRVPWWRVLAGGSAPLVVVNLLWAGPVLVPSNLGVHVGFTVHAVLLILMTIAIGNVWRTRYQPPMSWRGRETVLDERGITLTGWHATVPWADVTCAWAAGDTVTWELRASAYISSYTRLRPRYHAAFRRLFAANVLEVGVIGTGVAAETMLRTTYAYLPAADGLLIPALAQRTGAR